MTLVEPQGDEKLTLALVLVVCVVMVNVAGCSPVTCCVKGETVIRAEVLPLAVMVPLPVLLQRVTVAVDELPFWMEIGLGLPPMEHGAGIAPGVGVGAGVGVGVGVGIGVGVGVGVGVDVGAGVGF